MAKKCDCAGGRCSCGVIAGDGIEVTGSGEATNPYVVTAIGAPLSGQLTVADTPSLNLTLIGEGTVNEPYTISGDVVGVPGQPITGQLEVADTETLDLTLSGGGSLEEPYIISGDLVPGAVGEMLPVVLLRGPGIDTTGASDSTAAAQDLLDASAGLTVQVPAGDVVSLSAQLTVPDNTRLLGPGELRFTGGIEHTSAVRLGNNCQLVDMKVTNPNSVISGNTGGRSYGVTILGNEVVVEGCTVDNFENGIAVLSGGEWFDTRIINNRVSNVIGWNSVPSQTGTAGGEDRGDGIVTWGALATIIGNIVSAKPGYDARIGIHCESLKTEADVPSPHDDRMISVTANVVYGKFRRGITIEETKQAVVASNTVADSTWWGISVVLGEGHVVTGNTIRWTRTSADTQGSNYSPMRGPIAILKQSDATIITGNSIVHADGSSASGSIMLYSEGASDQPTDCLIEGNTAITVGSATVQDGIRSDGLNFTRPVIRNNLLSGFNRHGINMYTVDLPVIEGNMIRGNAATTGITKQNGGGNLGSITQNRIEGAATGINIPFAVGGYVAQNFINTATAFYAASATGNKVLDNKFGPLVTTYAFPTGTDNYLDGNLELQGTVVWDPPSIAVGASTTTTLTVTGATVGNSNHVLVGAPVSLQGLTATGFVSATDTVTIVLANLTAAAVNLASGTWKVRVLGR
jgi:Periplasmic copper-binding protein (NosD)